MISFYTSNQYHTCIWYHVVCSSPLDRDSQPLCVFFYTSDNSVSADAALSSMNREVPGMPEEEDTVEPSTTLESALQNWRLRIG